MNFDLLECTKASLYGGPHRSAFRKAYMASVCRTGHVICAGIVIFNMDCATDPIFQDEMQRSK